jgi:hypothetical protein
MTDRLRAFPALALTIAATALAGCGPSNLVRGLTNPGRLGFCGLLVVVLDILALVELWKSPRTDGDKLIWTAVIVIFPFFGLLAYYFIGRK